VATLFEMLAWNAEAYGVLAKVEANCRPTLRQPWPAIARAIERAVCSGSNMALLLRARSRQYRSRSKSRRATAAEPRRWTLRSGWPGATERFRLTDDVPLRPTTFQWR